MVMLWKAHTFTLAIMLLAAFGSVRVASFVAAPRSLASTTTVAQGSGSKRTTLGRLSVAQVSLSTPFQSLSESESSLPPVDETFSLFGTVRELLAAPVPPPKAKRYDGIGNKTGGIWRSRVLGILPRTVIASPQADKWVAMQEDSGNLVSDYPENVIRLLGPKSLLSLVLKPKYHAAPMRVFDSALSPRAMVNLQPTIEGAVAKRVARWHECAASGEEIKMLDDIRSFTLEAISMGILGAYASESVITDVARLLPIIATGVVSIPRRFGWPINKFPMFGFGRSLDARIELIEVVEGILQRRREDKEARSTSQDVSDGEDSSAGVLDALLEMQARQARAGGPEPGNVEHDDHFLVDNLRKLLFRHDNFARYDTTAVTLARMVQLLGSEVGKGVAAQLVEELNQTRSSGEKTLQDDAKSAPEAGIVKRYPLLHATFLESSRIYPMTQGVFRKIMRRTNYNGYEIPGEGLVQLNFAHGYLAESLYPEPEKFCPFRFLHGGEKNQSLPKPFGLGAHICRGKELAKLEILLFMRALLSNFDYDLVKGQSFKGALPTNEPKDNLRVVLRTKGSA